MASGGPAPNPSRAALAVAAWVALAGIAGAIFTPFRGAMIAIALIAGAFATITFRSLPHKPRKRKRGRNSPFIVMVPDEDDEMFSVLDSLGIPVAGTGGNAKAALFPRFNLLTTPHPTNPPDTPPPLTPPL